MMRETCRPPMGGDSPGPLPPKPDMKKKSLTLHGTLFCLISQTPLPGQTVWNNPAVDNQWNNPANWNLGDVPDSITELAEFGESTIRDIVLASAVTVKKLTWSGASGDYTLTGPALTVDVADPATGNTAVAVQMLAGAGTATINNLLNLSDAGGGNNSNIQLNIGSGRTLTLAGGASSATGNRNFGVAGGGVVNVFTSITSGTAQIQHSGNARLNLHVNPSATGQIRSFSNTGGIYIHANHTRPLGLGVTGSTSHVGRIFLAGDGVTSSGALTTTGATIAGPHNLDVTFGTDIPGAGRAVHSGTMSFGALTGTAANTGNAATIRLDVGADDTLVMSGVISGFPTGYATPLLRKQGPGTAMLTGPNTHTVPLEVAEGTLFLTPAQVGGASLTVQEGAVLGIQPATAGTSLTTTELTTQALSSSAGLWFNMGNTGNPTAPLINAGTFNPAGPTTIRLNGNLVPTAGVPFPVISYGNLTGLGFAGLSLVLPFRTTGALVNDTANSMISVNLITTGNPAWRGTVNANWDIDSAGDGSTGTANWSASSGPNTYVEGAPGGTDGVLFNDSATGSTTVVLTTALSPENIQVANVAKDYLWTGPGRLTGAGGIFKTGAGKLTIANAGNNDQTGGLTIVEGRVVIGNGTAGLGSLGGPVVIEETGTLELNRPDGAPLGSLTGNGKLQLTAGTASVSGGSFGGIISGPGGLTTTANLALTGFDPNTHTGLTTVRAGQLQLNKGGNAIAGNLLITDSGTLALQAGEQIPDTATITFTGTSADSVPTQTGTETVANVIVHPPVATGQFIMRQFMNVTGTAEAKAGILAVASSHSATVNSILLSQGAIVRTAGSAGASTLNVGPGGITATGGEIQVKFNTNAQDAVLNLGGDFTALGNVSITNAGFTGANLNVIDLAEVRTFNIATNTVTTVAPDLGGTGGLIKTGGGTLTLNDSCSVDYSGATTVSGGTLTVNGSILTSPVTVTAGGTLAGTGSIGPAAVVESGGTLAPGETATGTLTFSNNVSLNPGSAFVAGITGAASNDQIVAGGTLAAGGTIRVVLAGYAPVSGDVFNLADAASISGAPVFDLTGAALSGGLAWDTGRFLTDGTISVTSGTGTPFDSWTGTNGLTGTDAAKTADPDRDGVNNLLEFATNANPRAGSSGAGAFVKVHSLAGDSVLTLTIAARKNAVFAAAGTTQTATRDGVKYVVEAGDSLNGWAAPAVSTVSAPDAAAVQATLPLPVLEADWEWFTFRTANPVTTQARQFLRLRVE